MSGTTGKGKKREDEHDTASDADAETHAPPKKSLKKDSDEPEAESTFELYKGVATILSKYTIGSKFPDAFELIPSMQNWEEVLSITEPENWSPNAVYEATRIFVSNCGETKLERFHRLVLLPRIRKDIRENNHLHIPIYRSLQHAWRKPTAFCKGILFPLCESHTCTPREEEIVGSIIEKKSIPLLHLCVSLFRLAGMVYCGTISYFMKLLLEKQYTLPESVLDALVSHFMRFVNKTRITPVIWHQSLLTFVQRYKNELLKEDKDSLKFLLEKQTHESITHEIIRELNHSSNRDEKPEYLNSKLIINFIDCGWQKSKIRSWHHHPSQIGNGGCQKICNYNLTQCTLFDITGYDCGKCVAYSFLDYSIPGTAHVLGESDEDDRFNMLDFPDRYDFSDFPMEKD